jgi:phosphate transport system substrate-binding protein
MRIKVLLLAMAMALLLAACGGTEAAEVRLDEVTPLVTEVEDVEVTRLGEEESNGDSDTEANNGEEAILPDVDPLDVEGDIVTAGSSTVYPLTEAVATQFEDEGYGGQITIDSIGSGAGFERFCVAGETDLSNASRPINESEVESCRSIGREPIEFRVGTDALAVVVNQSNDFVEDVTMEELVLLFSTAELWSDVRPEWPEEEILRYIPGTDSGTFDYFVEAVFDENEEPILTASNLEMSENDNFLVQGVLGSPNAISFFGYAYYQENAAQLKVLAVNGVEPSEETVEAAEYPLARPLYIYSDAGVIQEKPQVAAFINYYLTNVNDVVIDVGYFPASDETLDEARAALAGALAE